MRTVFIREQADFLERNRIEARQILKNFRVRLEAEIFLRKIHEARIAIVADVFAGGESCVTADDFTVHHHAPTKRMFAVDRDVVFDCGRQRAHELVAVVTVDGDIVGAFNGLLMALALRADLVEISRAPLADAVERDDIAVNVHIAVIVVEIDAVAFAAAVNVIVAEGVVAIEFVLVVTIPAAHVVRNFAEIKNLVVFKQRIPTAEQHPCVRRAVNQIVRNIHAHRRMMPAATTAGETGIHARRINPLNQREVVNVIINNAMSGGNARVTFFIPTAQPHTTGTQIIKVATQNFVAKSAIQLDAVTRNIPHHAAGDQIAQAAFDFDAVAEIVFHRQLAQHDVRRIRQADDRLVVVTNRNPCASQRRGRIEIKFAGRKIHAPFPGLIHFFQQIHQPVFFLAAAGGTLVFAADATGNRFGKRDGFFADVNRLDPNRLVLPRNAPVTFQPDPATQNLLPVRVLRGIFIAIFKRATGAAGRNLFPVRAAPVLIRDAAGIVQHALHRHVAVIGKP